MKIYDVKLFYKGDLTELNTISYPKTLKLSNVFRLEVKPKRKDKNQSVS